MQTLKGTNYYFSSLRTGLAARVEATNNYSSPLLDIEVDTAAHAENAVDPIKKTAKLKIGLYGPGDVLGFDSSKVVSKLQPHDNDQYFNPDLIPCIEFSQADFLWRFSMDKGPESRYWQPWLSLVVLKVPDGKDTGEFSFVSGTPSHLPARISLAVNAVLPDLQEAWRWAHVHYVGEAGLERKKIQKRIEVDTQPAICRLMAVRRLEAGVKYAAFVVPTYQLGWLAAMGKAPSVEEDFKRKSWTGNRVPTNTEMPYYYYWDFRCGSHGGFEDLAKRITPTSLGTKGGQLFSTLNAGYKVVLEEDTYPMLTALEPLNTQPEPVASAQIAELLNRGEAISNATLLQQDRTVVPPIYGRWYVQNLNQPIEIKADRSTGHWLDHLNTDSRLRIIAGLGAQVVKENQDELLAEAWQQYSVIEEKNRQLQLGRFGIAIADRMYRRLKKVDKNTDLLQMTTSMHTNIASNEEQSDSVEAHLQQNEAPNALFNGKIRKFAKKLKGQQEMNNVLNINTIVSPVFHVSGTNFETGNFSIFTLEQPVVDAESATVTAALNPEMTIGTSLRKDVHPYRVWTAEKKAVLESESEVMEEEEVVESLQPLKWYPQFHHSVYEHLVEKNPDLIVPGITEMPQDSVAICEVNQEFVEAYLIGMNHELAGELRWREFPTDMRGSYFRKFWDATAYSVDEEEKKNFQKTSFGNRLLSFLKNHFPDHFSATQANLNWKALDEIIEKAEPTPVDLDILEQYEAAVEAWLVTREEEKDIHPLHQWAANSALGTHGKGKTTEGEQIVLLIRALLFRKFPNLLIYLAPKRNEHPDFSEATRKYPLFEGQVPPDIELVGFGSVDPTAYYLVFEERISEQRYGLDADANNDLTNADGSDLDDLAWSHFPIAAGEYLDARVPVHEIAAANWNNAAFIAKATTQQPVRFALELTHFLP